MNTKEIAVFFYGLFMDEAVLASRGVHASASMIGHVDGFRLRIGERATLVHEPDSRAYGVLMKMSSEDAATLYSEPSVSDYVAETVVVTLPGNVQVPAACYNLPAEKLVGTDSEYAAALLELASGLGLPEHYLEEIRGAGQIRDPAEAYRVIGYNAWPIGHMIPSNPYKLCK